VERPAAGGPAVGLLVETLDTGSEAVQELAGRALVSMGGREAQEGYRDWKRAKGEWSDKMDALAAKIERLPIVPSGLLPRNRQRPRSAWPGLRRTSGSAVGFGCIDECNASVSWRGRRLM